MGIAWGHKLPSMHTEYELCVHMGAESLLPGRAHTCGGPGPGFLPGDHRELEECRVDNGISYMLGLSDK